MRGHYFKAIEYAELIGTKNVQYSKLGRADPPKAAKKKAHMASTGRGRRPQPQKWDGYQSLLFRSGTHTLFSTSWAIFENGYHFPNKRWVRVAINVTSISKPTKASMAARTVSGSSSPIPPGKKPRP